MPQFPYTTTVSGLNAVLAQLRSNFPASVTADTLKKWGIAANNESSVIATLRFVRVVDDEGNRSTDAAKTFSIHDDAEFGPAFSSLIKTAYADLFELHAEKTWTLDKNKLINFFRQTDQTSARVGEQQAATFTALAAFAGHSSSSPSGPTNGTATKQKSTGSRRERTRTPTAPAATPAPPAPELSLAGIKGNAGLSVAVRIELNLPISDKQEVYDNIFRSIREHLIDA